MFDVFFKLFARLIPGCVVWAVVQVTQFGTSASKLMMPAMPMGLVREG